MDCWREACDGIKGTKQGDERAETRAKRSGHSHGRGSVKLIIEPSEDLISLEGVESEASSFSSLLLILCLLSSPGARLTGGSACPSISQERKPGVCVLRSSFNISSTFCTLFNSKSEEM